MQRFRGTSPRALGRALTACWVAIAAMLLLVGCQQATAATVPASPVTAPNAVVIVGDSLSTGFGTSAEDAWPTLVNNDPEDLAGGLEITNAARNGSGYVTVGDGNSTFAAQVAEAVTGATRLVVFFGSENDMGNSVTDIQAAARAAFAQAKARSPHAALLVVGPPSYTDPADAGRLAVRDAVQDAAEAAGATFVDPITEGWIVGDVGLLVGPDGVHPSVAGQWYLKMQMERLINFAVAQQAAGTTAGKG